jgi:hypothetical protein
MGVENLNLLISGKYLNPKQRKLAKFEFNYLITQNKNMKPEPKQKAASKIIKNQEKKKENDKFNKNHDNQFGHTNEEIKHNGNHGKDTFGV